MRPKLLLVVALVGAVAIAGPVPNAFAATFSANSTADEPDSRPGDGLCLTAAGNCTFRAAVQETNALGGLHTVALLGGATYTLTRAGAGDDAAATGDLDIRSNVTITASGGRAVVRGATGWSDRVLHILSGASVELNGLDIQNGRPAASGGGIRIDFDGILALANSTVTGNTASGSGGGIFNSGGTLTLTNSTVSGNSGGPGGLGGGISNLGTLTLTNSTVSGNSHAGDVGGIANAGTLTLTNSTVSENSTLGTAGGLLNEGLITPAQATLTNSTVSDNSSGINGGGIVNNSSTLTLTNSTVSGNSASGYGGGIRNAFGTVTLTNTTVSANVSARDGGGVWNNGTVTANNVTIAKNVADSNADGDGDGGGVFTGGTGTVSVANTMIGTNVDTSAATKFPDCLGSLTSRGYNLIQNTTGCTIGGETAGNIIGRDPQLGPFQDNGGPTFTHALLIVSKLGGFTIPSPAIDAGSPSGAGTACAAADQRGVNRIDGNADGVARCDIGAYEYVPPLFRLGTQTLAPAEATVHAGERLSYTLTWTVPPPRGWRGLRALELAFLDDEGIAQWVRFEEVAGAPGLFRLVNPKNGNAGPAFAPESPNRLESEFATVYLAETAVDGPLGPKVTLTLTLRFKPHAAGRSYDVLVAATDDGGEVQGFHRAGGLAVSG
jgi:hypothetical protein